MSRATEAEALREAADWLNDQRVMTLYPTETFSGEEVAQRVRCSLRDCATRLRAMADREGK